MRCLCECDSPCRLVGDVPVEVIRRCCAGDLVVILDGCEHGPEPGEVLVERGEGWALYRIAEGVTDG